MRKLFSLIFAFFFLSACGGRRVERELFPYRVVCGETRGRLADTVSAWMRQGWRAQGGVAIVRGDDGRRHYCQAIVRER